MNILHISDLHVNSPNSHLENLRISNFKPFINNLKLCVEKNGGISKFDYIIATGDFIDRGKVDNFEHVRTILDHICEIFECDRRKIITCIGNHDYIKDNHTSDPDAARIPYANFAKNYNPEDLKYSESLFKIYKHEDNHFLIFDSTFKNGLDHLPCDISEEEIDNVYLKIEKEIPPNGNLFILSHYPLYPPPNNTLLIEEPGFIENHIWKSGYFLMDKIDNYRLKGKNYYFFGDIHWPEFSLISPRSAYFFAGILGSSTDPTYTDNDGRTKAFNKIIMARQIIISDPDVIVKTFKYTNKGLKISSHCGSWNMASSNLSDRKSYIVSNKSDLFKDNEDLTMETHDEPTIELPRVHNDKTTELISESIEKEILAEISNNNLYHFGRFITSHKYSSLGWVDIDALMNNSNIFSRCIEKVKSIFLDKLISNENSILIGLDYWGSCIATHVSIMSEISNWCVATKSKGKYNIEEEKLSGNLLNLGYEVKNIIIFSDVVSTGNSIDEVANLIKEKTARQDINFSSISIISDPHQLRVVDFSLFSFVYSFCIKLRIPIVENEEMPDSNIINPIIDLRE